MKNIGWFALLGILLILWVIAQFNPASNEPTGPTKSEAFAISKKFVSERLKSPATAEFASIVDSKIESRPEATYAVESFVDSQNTFGAIVRTKYTATIRFEDDGRWHLVDLKMN